MATDRRISEVQVAATTGTDAHFRARQLANHALVRTRDHLTADFLRTQLVAAAFTNQGLRRRLDDRRVVTGHARIVTRRSAAPRLFGAERVRSTLIRALGR